MGGGRGHGRVSMRKRLRSDGSAFGRHGDKVLLVVRGVIHSDAFEEGKKVGVI